MATCYFTSVLQPFIGADLGQRSRQELRTIAETVDAMLRGDVVHAADILMARFSAVETAATSKQWGIAKHLEIIPGQKVSSVPGEMLELATSAERREVRSQAQRVSLG